MLAEHEEAVLAVALAGNYVVSGSYDHSVRFWRLDAEGDGAEFEFGGHGDAVRVLVAAEGGGAVYSGSYDGSIGFIDLPGADGAWEQGLLAQQVGGGTRHSQSRRSAA